MAHWQPQYYPGKFGATLSFKWMKGQRNSLAQNSSNNETITNQEIEQLQILTLEDEGAQEIVNAPTANTSIASDLPSLSTRELREHNIHDFLNRLYEIDNFTWSINDAKGKVLKTYRFPDALLNMPAITAKTRNFFGLRAGVEFIILVNKQPFQAGNLLISFLPNARYNDTKRAVHLADMQGIVSRSGAPRTNLDLMDATRASLTVPYASPFVYYNLLTNQGTIGDFSVSVYSPLKDVATAGLVSIQVMARFVDIDIQFPTGEASSALGTNNRINQVFNNMLLHPTRENLVNISNLSRQMLADIDGTPMYTQASQCLNFKQKALPNMANSNNSNQTHMLSLSSRNSLLATNTGEASQNEMSFSKILSIPCYWRSFTISNTDTAGTNKFAHAVEPLNGTDIVNTDTSFSADYIYAVSQLFSKWRGSIDFHFRIIKTQFHSLRVRVWFSPGSTSEANVDRNSCISKIIDLKELNHFTFSVPYVHPYPFLNTRSNTTSLGLIGIDIVNQMVNPSTVTSSIEVIIERSAGSDFELNLPTSFTSFPFNPTVPTIMRTQGFEQDQMRQGFDDTSYTRPLNSLNADKYTLGQEINNVNQLIKRSTLFSVVDSGLVSAPEYRVQTGTGTCDEVTLDIPALAAPYTLADGGVVTLIQPLVVLNTGTPIYYILPAGSLVSFEHDTEHFIFVNYGTATYQLATNFSGTTDTSVTFTIATPTTTIPRVDVVNSIAISDTLSNPIHILPHSMGVAQNLTTGLAYSANDNLSYFSSMYSFARGGINLRVIGNQNPYVILVDPSNDINQDSGTSFPPVSVSTKAVSSTDLIKISNTIQQAINPAVEGFGEFNVPFYSNTHCYSISNSLNMEPVTESNNFRLPDTHLVYLPNGAVSETFFYRAAASDFEFSYLSGPPLLISLN